jgi:hypothetical protein
MLGSMEASKNLNFHPGAKVGQSIPARVGEDWIAGALGLV